MRQHIAITDTLVDVFPLVMVWALVRVTHYNSVLKNIFYSTCSMVIWLEAIPRCISNTHASGGERTLLTGTHSLWGVWNASSSIRPWKPRYILERTILETENAQSRILAGSCKQGVQALDIMNCTTHIVQDFAKLLQTHIWVRVVVITKLNYVLDASAFLTISAILGLTTCLPL